VITSGSSFDETGVVVIITGNTTDRSVRRNSPSVCVVLGLCAVASTQLAFYGRLVGAGIPGDPVLDYAAFGWLTLALVAWRQSPQRSWRWLLIVGALATVPSHVFAIVPAYVDWMRIPYLLIESAAWPFVMVGVFGAATAAWRSGLRVAGAIGFGAPLVVSTVAGIVAARLAFSFNAAVPLIGLLVGAGTVLAARTEDDRSPVEPHRPTWQVTVACVVASLAPMLLQATSRMPFASSDQYLLIVGSSVLGIALAAGAIAGLRVLVAGSVAGLLLSAMTSLNRIPGLTDLDGLVGGSYVVGGLAALAAGIVLTRSPAMAMIGALGLGVVVLALLVLLMFSVESGVAAPILLIPTVMAAVPALASLGTLLAENGDGPAAFVGLTVGVTVGLDGLAGHVRDTAVESPAVGAYLSAAVFLALAAVLTVFANRRFVQAGG
jgi:hypothetical protein